jgi:hypothetical protein
MFIEAIDQLRCVRDHEESWLIASFTEMRGRDLWAGELGCHICGARYPVVRGIAQFSNGATAESADYGDAPGGDDVVALAAMLDLTEPGKIIALSGEWARYANALSEMVDAGIFCVNASAAAGSNERICFLIAESVPIRSGILDGAAIGASDSDSMLQSAVRALKPGGRLVVAHPHKLPQALTLIAGDDIKWVAEKSRALTPLRRASR